MAGMAKVVLTDYVWESLDVERKTLDGLAELVPLQTKKPEEFLAQAEDCDALLNTYAGPITADASGAGASGGQVQIAFTGAYIATTAAGISANSAAVPF